MKKYTFAGIVGIIGVTTLVGAGCAAPAAKQQAPAPEPQAVETGMPVPTEENKPTEAVPEMIVEKTPATTTEDTKVEEKKAAASAVREFTVDGSNFAFAPSTMTVKKGDTVKITFKNVGGFHDLKIDEFNVATKKIGNGESDTITFVADKAGSFEYYCSVGSHRAMGMKGTLIVE